MVEIKEIPMHRDTSTFIVLVWFAAIAIKQSCADPHNCTDVDFVVPPSQNTENNHTHYVGKLWTFDCRIKDNASVEVKLYQEGRLRKSDGRVLILKDQVFTLFSKNASDIGEYLCKSCNKSKIVGKLVADTSRRYPTIYPLEREPILPGSNKTYSCEVEGVYHMSWYRVAHNGSKNLIQSEETSYWKNGFWFTRHRFVILNFTKFDEDLYMCVIKRSTDDYFAEKEIFLALRDSLKEVLIPIHWYYTSYSITEIDGHLFRTIVHVYICHLPVIVNLVIWEPVKGVLWSKNFTTDQSRPIKLDRNSQYGVKLQMHVRSHGRYKDHLRIMAWIKRLKGKSPQPLVDVMNQRFQTNAVCYNREKCRQLAPNSLECPRYMDTLEETLNATFRLTLLDPCNGTFNLQIRDRSSNSAINSSLLDMVLENNTRARMQLKGYDNKNDQPMLHGKVKFSQMFLKFLVNEVHSKTHRVKLLYEVPSVGMSGGFLIMEGDYVMNCSSQGGSGENTRKIVAVILIAIVGLVLLLFAAVFLYRKFRHRPRDELLLESMELESEIYNL